MKVELQSSRIVYKCYTHRRIRMILSITLYYHCAHCCCDDARPCLIAPWRSSSKEWVGVVRIAAASLRRKVILDRRRINKIFEHVNWLFHNIPVFLSLRYEWENARNCGTFRRLLLWAKRRSATATSTGGAPPSFVCIGKLFGVWFQTEEQYSLSRWTDYHLFHG